MQLPDTDNIHLQYAFKTGYRLALEGKTMSSMPSAIRREMAMRDYFQQGWEQGHQDVSEGLLNNVQPCWKCRFIWGSIMILGGAATAYSIIYSYEKEQAQLAQQAQIQYDQAALATTHNPTSSLSLLSPQQRQDLQANLAEYQKQLLPPLTPIIASPIKISAALSPSQIYLEQNIQISPEHIPKYIRNLNFLTNVKVSTPQTLYHRWRFENQAISTKTFYVKPPGNELISSQKMSSAWQGHWYIEVLNAQQEVIYRKTFIYGNHQ